MFYFTEFPQFAYDWWTRWGFVYPACFVTACFAAFAYGACLGSFMNVCIWRMPRGESVVHAPSHCTKCGAHIRWYDNLPVVSYIALRGRCRSCHAPYSPRYFAVEVLCGALFVAVLIKCGLTRQVPGAMLFYCVALLFVVAGAWIDAVHRIIPDKLTFPAMVIALAASVLLPEVWGTESRLRAAGYSLLSGALPGAFLWLFSFLGARICRRDVMGLGDVKFAAALGMLLGLPGAVFSLLFGSLAGALAGGVCCLVRRRSAAGYAIPFGPFLGAGALVWIFAGNLIVHWMLERGFRL